MPAEDATHLSGTTIVPIYLRKQNYNIKITKTQLQYQNNENRRWMKTGERKDWRRERENNKEEKEIKWGREDSGFEPDYLVKLNGELKSANWRMTHQEPQRKISMFTPGIATKKRVFS